MHVDKIEIDTNNFKLVSSTSQIPENVRNLVRPGKQIYRTDEAIQNLPLNEEKPVHRGSIKFLLC